MALIRKTKLTGFLLVVMLLVFAAILMSYFPNTGKDNIVIIEPVVLRAKDVVTTRKPQAVEIIDPPKVNSPPEPIHPLDPFGQLYEQQIREPNEFTVPTLQERMRKRKLILRRACKMMQDLSLSSPNSKVFNMELYKHLMVNEVKKVLYCFLPKVANTNFRRVFLGVQGVVPKAEVPNVSGYDIYFTYNNKFKYVIDFNEQSKIQMLQTYGKFMFVRDPLERLLSGYRNKFFHPNSGHKAEYHNKVLEFYRKHPTLQRKHNMRQSFRDKEMTFQEFLTYWTDVFDAKEYLNEHFVPSNLLCDPCRIDFDYIGKYEEVNTEVSYIFESLKIGIDFPARNDNYSTVATSTLINDFYKPIPDWLLLKTWDILKFDYILFGYRLPDWFYERVRHSK